MDKIKSFFVKKKVNKTFKKAGDGRRLDEGASASAAARPPAPRAIPVTGSRSVHDADILAHAALKRMNMGQQAAGGAPNRSNQAIKLEAKRQLERERLEQESQKAETEKWAHLESAGGRTTGGETRTQTTSDELEHPPTISGVYFTCELLGDDLVLPKHEMTQYVGSFLEAQLADEPLVAASLMIQSLNSSEKRKTAAETIGKYLENIRDHPSEDKYRKIRLGNKAFQERVAMTKGGREFLTSVGFVEADLPFGDEQIAEKFLVMPVNIAKDTENISQAIEILMAATPVPLKLHRNVEVLRPCTGGRNNEEQVYLPREFFSLSADEVKAEQQRRSEQVEKMTTLRTKAMREKDEQMKVYKYKYSLIRIKFPGEGLILQATFGTYEPFSEVRALIRDCLEQDWIPFLLKSPSGGLLDDDCDTKSLGDLALTPSALLRFELDDASGDLAKQLPVPLCFLKSEMVLSATDLLN